MLLFLILSSILLLVLNTTVPTKTVTVTSCIFGYKKVKEICFFTQMGI